MKLIDPPLHPPRFQEFVPPSRAPRLKLCRHSRTLPQLPHPLWECSLTWPRQPPQFRHFSICRNGRWYVVLFFMLNVVVLPSVLLRHYISLVERHMLPSVAAEKHSGKSTLCYLVSRFAECFYFYCTSCCRVSVKLHFVNTLALGKRRIPVVCGKLYPQARTSPQRSTFTDPMAWITKQVTNGRLSTFHIHETRPYMRERC